MVLALPTIRVGKNRVVQRQQNAVRLGFLLRAPHPGAFEVSICSPLGGRVSKSNGSYFYSIGTREPTDSEMRLAAIAKAAVIDKLAASDAEISLKLIDSARAFAKDMLLRHTDEATASYVSYLVAHDTVGFGPISMLMEDRSNIEEIEINTPTDPICVYTSNFGRCATNLAFTGEQSFRQGINKLIYECDKELGIPMPIVDAQVADMRVHAQIRPYAVGGGAASIRIGRGRAMGAYSLLKNKTLTPELLAYLWIAIDAGMNIIVSGAPGSGKTTLVYALAQFAPPHNKVLTIEDEVNELHLNGPLFNTVALYGSKSPGGITAKAQVINALRMRPDRIVIGEIRGEEAGELFSGANLGTPFLTTMHSNDEELAVVKKLLIKPMCVEQRALSMLDLSIHMFQTGISQRVVSSVVEYRWLSRAETDEGITVENSDMVKASRVAENASLSKSFVESSKVMEKSAKAFGLSRAASKKEFEKRTALIKQAQVESRDEESFCERLWKLWYV